jgi:hypothetical protein
MTFSSENLYHKHNIILNSDHIISEVSHSSAIFLYKTYEALLVVLTGVNQKKP